MRQRQQPAVGTTVRSDIQGVRALAVGIVVLYHLWPHRLPGGFIGVDVFFVVSGYLITAHILKGLERKSRGEFLVSFYARRIRRLAPAAVTVLVAVIVGVALFVPMSLWNEEYSGVLASALFVENWHLGFQAVDYLAAENAATAVQHYWSLSVEEQFYIAWPLLLVATMLCVRSRRALGVVIATISVVSFAYGLWITAVNPDLAYFATPARAWQFGVGALLVFISVRSPRLGLWLPWLGVILLGGSAVLGTGTSPYPGWIALLPTIGAALMLVGRERESRFSFGSIAAWAPVRWLGDVSYSVYLWHWPLIVLVPFATGHPLNLWEKLLVLLVTLLLGGLSYTWIETPFRRSAYLSKTSRTIGFGVVALLLVTVPATLAIQSADRATNVAEQSLQSGAAELPACFGALAIDDLQCDDGESISPETAAAAKSDKPLPWPDGCANGLGEMSEVVCSYGARDAADQVLLWGDSHAGAWAPALDQAGKQGDFAVTVAMRHGCPAAATAPVATSVGRAITAEEQTNCQKRNDWVMQQLAPQYDRIIIANMSTNYRFEGDPAHEYAGAIDTVSANDTSVALLQDLPLTGDDMGNRVNGPDCLAQNGACENSVERALSATRVTEEIARLVHTKYYFIETASRFCDDRTCQFARGGVSVYFDASHLSNAYSTSLGEWLLRQLPW